MASPVDLAHGPAWQPDASDTDHEMSDDDFDYDHVSDATEGIDETGQPPVAAQRVPVWRRIEMAREDRFLQRELADFEDYDYADRYADAPIRMSY